MESRRLVKWFQKEKRSFPWRTLERDPYSVWVSEMMLQQTRAQVVIPYYQRWMSRFPTIQDLAKASIDEVIKLWEGLGYYSRARNLHTGAKLLVESFQGKLPDNEAHLKTIKGLGPYTIGAILSFGFKKKAVAIDGNAIRVLTRYFGIQEDVSRASTLRQIQTLAYENLPEKDPWVFTEALIEMGATLCTPKPKCSLCPLKSKCIAKKLDLTSKIPFKSKREKITPLYRGVAVISSNHQYLVKRSKEGIMRDLFEFPYLDFEKMETDILLSKTCTYFEKKLNIKLSFQKIFPQIAHSFTRYRAFLTPFLLYTKTQSTNEEYQWFPLTKLHTLPFSAGHRRILELL